MKHLKVDYDSLLLLGVTLIFNSLVLFLWLGFYIWGGGVWKSPADVIMLYVHSRMVVM